ncbi:HB2D protein, partial [Amia calva]|nr:HB2D protein [Amia calva]
LYNIFSVSGGYAYQMQVLCKFNKGKMDELVLIDRQVFNKIMIVEYDSRVGKFVGYTTYGMYIAEKWNKQSQFLAELRFYRDEICKPGAENVTDTIFDKTVEPTVSVSWTPALSSKQPTTLACHAFGFYPQQIKVTWLRNGAEVKHGVMFTDLMADGDWYYQIHSHLELTPRSGETISCRVEHSSLKEPLEIKWGESPVYNSAPLWQKTKLIILI